MSKKLKRPIAFIATLAMILSMLLYLPSGVMTDIGFGLAVSAEDATGTTSGEGNTSADTGTTGGTGETPDNTDGTGETPDNTDGTGETPANTDGTGETPDNTDNGEDSTDEPAAVESESVMLLAEGAATITPSQPTGDGSVGSPYQIGTAAELYWFAAQVNSGSTTINAVLKADITVNTGVLTSNGVLNTNGSFTSWTPIGTMSNPYTGTFYGQNNTISGLYFDDGNTNCVGLFGYVGSGGNVSNVGIVDSYFNGKWHVGGVCGMNECGTIQNCYNTGAVKGSDTVGGVCGSNIKSTIENCYNTGAVKGSDPVGGVCGYNYNGTITNCYFDSKNYLGGAVGSTDGGTITYVEGKTTNAFEKGEVCYLLQSGQEKDSGSGKVPMVWGQTIGTDKAPVLTSDSKKTVYRIGETYSNTNSEITGHEHNFGANFRCTNCGNYEAPELNENVYEITNASQLYWFAEYVNNGNTSAEAILTKNIVVNANVLDEAGNLVSDTSNFVSWTPIGNSSKQYTGTFNGNGKTISGLYLYNGDKSYVGLFGHVGSSGNVSNVGVVASYFKGKNNVGGVCGNNNGTIQNCYSTGGVSGSNNVGGVCGYNYGTIQNCYNTGAVKGSDTVGGVCGWNKEGTITNCYNTGVVSGSYYVGGVCGYNEGGTIKNCYYLTGTATCGIYGTDDVANNVLVKTKTQFTFGEVAYLLWQGCTVNEVTYDGSVWGQTIGADNYPVLGGAPVYKCTKGCTAKYSNEQDATGKHTAPDTYDNGFGKCTDCNVELYQPAEQTTTSGIYEIGNAGQLYWFAQQVNGGNIGINAILTDNITVNTGGVADCDGDKQDDWRDWTPIGNSSNIYTGTFDGNGKTVSGLYFNDTAVDYVGLFGYNKGTIQNVGVVDSYFNGNENVGGVCGYNLSGTITNCYNINTVKGYKYVGGVCGYNKGLIENCHNTGDVSAYKKNTTQTNNFVGGVCGYNLSGTITNCYNTGEVTGKARSVGGVCGYNKGLIENCYNTGEVIGKANYVGGVCGYNYSSSTISNCYNTGTVSGENNHVGGVCGYNYSSSTISNCYNTGTVSGTNDVGGVCGENDNGTIRNCYNTGEVSGTNVYVGGVCGYNDGSSTISNCYNTGEVIGKSDFVGGVCGYNYSSTISNCYYLEGTATGGIGKNNGTSDKVESKTAAQFGSGEVAYLLQSGQTADENGIIPEVWGQTLTGDEKQDFPVLGGAKVYQTTPCVSYSNDNVTEKKHTDNDNDNLCDNCKETYKFKVETVSSAENVDVSSVANLNGGGIIMNGESTPITASAVPGYTFNGWYNVETLLSADLSFVYTPTADVTLTAKYTANAKMTVNINGGTSYSVSVNGGTASDYSTSTSPSYEVGTRLTVTANGENFAYWQNEAGSVLSRSAEYTFTVVNNATVTAVYDTKVDSKAIVNFISGYDQIINRYQIAAADDFTVPAAPTKTGCDFAGWSINGGAAVTENVADAVKAAITAALETEDTADDIINVKATYTTKVQKVTITVTNGDGGGEYNVNDVVTVTANAPESGNKFSHWTDGNGMILSYNTSYSFYAAKNITVEAVYVEEAATVEAKGTTEIVDVIKDTVNGKISFVSMSTVPEGCKIQNAGLVATMTAGDFDATNARAVKVGTTSASAYRYTWTVPVSSTDVIYVRAYLVYSDKNGNVHTIYGNIVTGSLNG